MLHTTTRVGNRTLISTNENEPGSERRSLSEFILRFIRRFTFEKRFTFEYSHFFVWESPSLETCSSVHLFMRFSILILLFCIFFAL